MEARSGGSYGKGSQDVRHRVPKIDNTMQELGWKPEVTMEQSLRRIFEAYRDKVVEARTLVDGAKPSDFFQIPANRVVELGTKVEI